MEWEAGRLTVAWTRNNTRLSLMNLAKWHGVTAENICFDAWLTAKEEGWLDS